MIHHLITLLFVPIFAQMWPNPGPGHAPTNAGGCASYLLCQNFETPTTGYDNGETWSEFGTVDHAYTAAPIRGSQSLRLPPQGSISARISNSFTARSDVWTFCDLKLPALLISGNITVFQINNGSAKLLTLLITSAGAIYAYNDTTGFVGPSGTTFVATTLYHVWLHYTASGTCSLYMSTTTTRPSSDGSGNVKLDIAAGVATQAILITASNDAGDSVADCIFDHILVSTSAIGNNP